MFIREELNALRRVALPWFYAFILITFFLFFFGFRAADFLGRRVYIPYPSIESVAVKVFLLAKERVLPPDVSLVVTDPLSGFVVTAGTALILSFVITFPWFLRSFLSYIFEALYESEKKAVRAALFPAMLLFIGGFVFGFFVILPPTFSVLYQYATSLQAENFLSLGEFALFVFGICLACGLVFLTPALMAGLNYAGVTERKFWIENWRTALFIFVVLSAIITPDGSGLTMLLLSVPLTGLYFVGAMLGARNGRK